MFDLRLTPKAQRRRFFSSADLIDREAMMQTQTWQTIYGPSGVADQMRLIVTHGESIVSYVLVLRFRGSPLFEREPALQRLTPAIRRALVTADALDQHPHEPADFILDGSGRMCFASSSGRAWLAVPGVQAAIAARVRKLDSGEDDGPEGVGWGEASICRVTGSEGVRYLVHVLPRQLLPLLGAASLSPTQLEIAKLAAAGASVPDIGGMMGRSQETVRSHLREVYRRLHIGSRAELGAAMRETCGSVAFSFGRQGQLDRMSATSASLALQELPLGASRQENS
ncbi:MAG: helix-turn-helix transcriptional regulator [Deltaproteobacteria bacterium]|nr:helix-turn-helix transcriptional regulator [Deltaproteobacteria bacterium]